MRRILLSFAVLATACAPPIESAGVGHGEQAQVIGAPRELSAQGALAAYVAQPDDAFAFQPIAQISVPGGTAYILSMTSQRWRTEAEVTPTLWSHYVTIVVPSQVWTTTANLIIFGGSMGSPPDAGDLALPLQFATATRSIVVGVSQIPGQPLQFADLPQPVHEDALVAYSWDKAMATGDPTWAAYLPMTKAVVRAMDATQSFCAQALGRTVSDFLVTGFSKRGATTWLVGAVDPRVRGIVPGVFDILDMGPQLDHHYRSYGAYSYAVDDYTAYDIPLRIRSPEGRFLTSIVDPWSYAPDLTMPKLVLSAAGDEFFLPDAAQRYIDKLPGETSFRLVANADHSVDTEPGMFVDALMGIVSWQQSVLYNVPRPALTWGVNQGVLEVQASAGGSAKVWTAENPSGRDFRYATVGSAWTASPLAPDADGKLRTPLTAPATGYRAAFIEVVFPGAFGVPIKLSTPAYVSPDNEPFEMPAPAPDPQSGNAWWHDVREAMEGDASQYSLAEYEGFLPFFVFGNHVADMDTLEHALHPGGGVAGAATQACTAVRLDIASGRLGWYSQAGDDLLWEEYERAEQAMLDGDAHEAFEICRDLSQRHHPHHH